MKWIKCIFTIVLFLSSSILVAQKDSIAQQRKARKMVRQGNQLYQQEKFTDASVAYQKALNSNSTYEKAS